MPKTEATDRPRRHRPSPLAIPAGWPFRGWIDGFAESERLSITALFDRSVAEYAKARGYAPPPPRNAQD